MIENKISPLIESQFPSFYKKEGKQFIAFVTAYYKWLEETGNPIHEARKIPEYTDIDNTVDEFIIHFKEKYLKNIQFDTATNKRLLVKHATDLYKSKGTEQSIDLFFKLVYGVDADIVYPSEKIFKTSSSVYEKPIYIEVSDNENNKNYVGKQIVGSDSGATAFVERYVRRKLSRGYTNILYISNKRKDFVKNEVLGVLSNNKPLFDKNNSMVLGSTNSIELFDRGKNYNVGDIVTFDSSNRGIGGLARVESIQDASGVVDFTLQDGGFGYTLTSNTIISEKVINYESYSTSNTLIFDVNERVYQPIIALDFAYDGILPIIGDKLYQYSNVGDIITEADIVKVVRTGNNISVSISPVQGNYIANTVYYLNSNTYNFTANTVIDKTISAISMGKNKSIPDILSGNLGVYNIGKYINRLVYNSANNKINSTNRIYQYTANNISAEGLVITTTIPSSNSGNLTFIPIKGYFDDKEKVFLSSNSGSFNITDYRIEESGGDLISSDSYIYGPISNTKIFNVTTSFGSGADYKISTINNPYEVIVSEERLDDLNQEVLDYKRKIIGVSSNMGFSINDIVIQDINKIKFNPTGIVANSGFIPVNSANTRFPRSSIIKYTTDSGNTIINGLANNNYYYVYSSNSTGLILSYPYRLDDPIANTNFPDFANNAINQIGHSFSIEAGGLIKNISANNLYIKNNPKLFGLTGGTSNTTSSSNSNIYLLSNNSVNTSIVSITDDTSILVSRRPFYSLDLNSNVYGFPKNKQGNSTEIIFNLLEFSSQTIGSIFSIGSINPGSDYNVDPYTIVYNRSIAAFDLKDYIFNIENPTGTFKKDEIVFQTALTNKVYDTIVSNGVFSENSIEKTCIFDSKLDIDSNNDLIYFPYIEKTFNSNTSISSNSILLENDFTNNDLIRYYTNTGNTAITGLSNNSLYYIVSANSTSIKLSNTSNGSILGITPSLSETGHNIRVYRNLFSNNIPIKYTSITGNTITGLTDNQLYYTVNSSLYSFSVSNTLSGNTANITALSTSENQLFTSISGFKRGDLVYQEILKSFNANSAVNSTSNFISITSNPYSIGNKITYYTSSGNTVISGLSNNAIYYIKTANSTGITVSSTLGGNTVSLTKGLTETGHNILAVSNSSIKSVYIANNQGHVILNKTDNGIANSFELKSYINLSISGNLISFELLSESTERKGIVKSSNSTILKIKRLSIDEPFKENELIYGEETGTSALIKTIESDNNSLPIGLNANISANVITADGQVKALQVIDSGFGYSNNETILFKDLNSDRIGTGKIKTGSAGQGKGYYKSRKGFLSSDSHLHDGDYYQEYSYEVQSRISIDRFGEMFKKVMHTAGTKFFSSILISTKDSVNTSYLNSQCTPEIVFNSNTDIAASRILIADNPFSVNNKVTYYTGTGNTVVSGLSNNGIYYIKTSNSTGISLSNSINSNSINIIASSINESGHYIFKVE